VLALRRSQQEIQVEGPGCPVVADGAVDVRRHHDGRHEAGEEFSASNRIGLEEREKVLDVIRDGGRMGNDAIGVVLSRTSMLRLEPAKLALFDAEFGCKRIRPTDFCQRLGQVRDTALPIKDTPLEVVLLRRALGIAMARSRLNFATKRSMSSGCSSFSFNALTRVLDAFLSETESEFEQIAAPRDACAVHPNLA
jgi:hypothetical protein